MGLRSVFSRARPDPIRGVHLYFSAGSVIVAAVHQNLAGIYHEQAGPVVLQGAPSAAQLGEAFQAAFQKFSMRDTGLRETRRSEWPAYRASGARSMKEFERLFRPMTCYSVNSSNVTVRASVAHASCPGIELATSFNPLDPAEAVGESLIRLVKAADAT